MNKSKLTNYIFLLIIFSLFFSHIIAIGYSNEVGITDGMYVNYTTSDASRRGELIPTTITFSKTSDEIFHVEWEWKGSYDILGSWDVTISTKIVSNMVNFGPQKDSHDPFWIYTDVSLNDQIILYNAIYDFSPGVAFGDTVFNITGEAMYKSMEVWELRDAFGSVVWYEKSKGFLLNGTQRYLTDWQKFEFEGTNAFKKAVIPGYNYFFLIGLLLVSAIVILKNKSIRE